MSDQTYLFIDGEYLRHIHRETMQTFFHEDGVLQLSTLMEQAHATRAYLYDSMDDAHLPGETEEARSRRLAPLTHFFDYVQSLSGFHVRLGTVTGQGKRKRRQKEVDILLAVDMLTHGFNGSMQQAVLLAGDLDFRPIVETLVRQGVFVEVWYHKSSIARDLPGAADFGHQLRLRQMYEWNTQSFRDSHHLPSEQLQAGSRWGNLKKTGAIASTKIELYETIRQPPNEPVFSLWIEVDRHQSLLVMDDDLELLERYVELQHGPIRWSAERATPEK